MSQVQTEDQRLDKYAPIVDTDAHVFESVDDVVPYLDDDYTAVEKIIQETRRPLADIYSSTHCLPPFPFIDTEYLAGEAELSTQQGYLDYSPETKLAEMEEFGIDTGIISTTLNLAINTVENPQFAVALANAYNSWVLDNYLDESDIFVGSILAAPQKPEIAADEIDDRASEDDFVGVLIPSTGVLPPLGHPRYDPIYEAAERHGLPLLMHGGAGATPYAFPTQRRWNETYTENHVIVHPFGHMWNLTTMVVRGVPERFPDLEFVFQEAGVAWIPYTKWRLDDHYLELPHEFQIERMPSEYFDDQFYFTTQPLGHVQRPTEMGKIIEIIGADSVMYSSDLPHKDFDPPGEMYEKIRSVLDDEAIGQIMGGNATTIFDV